MNKFIKNFAEKNNIDLVLDGMGYGGGNIEELSKALIKECVEVAANHVGSIEGVDFGLADECYKHFGIEK